MPGRWAPAVRRAGVAGGWGLPGAGIRRPPSAGMAEYTGLLRLPIRPGEGTLSRVIPAGGSVSIALGPDALNTWYVSHCAIETTSGAADTSTCAIQLGPFTGGIVPGGQSYAGGGDTVSLGGKMLKPGDYVTAIWSGAKPGDQATLTIYGEQDVLA
jgi:hypothetical protein